MITLQKIRYKNFLSTGRSWIEIDLTSYKTTLIVGPNGAGKSTMLDALSFVLFNKPFREINKGQVVNSITRKECVVEAELLINGKHYLVRRGIKPNIFEILIDGAHVPSTASATDFQSYLEEQILGLNHKSFIQVVMLGSALYVPFMKLKAAQRREVVEDLLDLGVFSDMNAILKDDNQQIDREINLIYSEQNTIKTQIDMYHKMVSAAQKDNEADIVLADKQIAECTAQIEGYKFSSKQMSEQINGLLVDLKDRKPLDAKVEKLREMITTARVKIGDLDTKLAFFSKHATCPTCTQAIAGDHKVTIEVECTLERQQLEDALAKMSEKYTSIAAEIRSIDSIQNQINDYQRKIADAVRNIVYQEQNITAAKASIKKALAPREIPDFDLAQAKNSLVELDQKLNDLDQKKRVQKYASVLLKDSGTKSVVIKQYVPVFNKLINQYLAALDFFVDFNLDENFNETIRSRYRDDFSYNSFSEGQKMRIDLALMFTWRAIARERNSININVLILDEVLDSSLDTSGTDDFLSLIKKLTNDDNILVISHKGKSIHDQFDRVIEFDMVKNFSQMNVET